MAAPTPAMGLKASAKIIANTPGSASRFNATMAPATMMSVSAIKGTLTAVRRAIRLTANDDNAKQPVGLNRS